MQPRAALISKLLSILRWLVRSRTYGSFQMRCPGCTEKMKLLRLRLVKRNAAVIGYPRRPADPLRFSSGVLPRRLFLRIVSTSNAERQPALHGFAGFSGVRFSDFGMGAASSTRVQVCLTAGLLRVFEKVVCAGVDA